MVKDWHLNRIWWLYRSTLVCVALMLNVIRYSCHYFLDRILFHHDFHLDSCDYHWDFMAINYLLIFTVGFFTKVIRVLQMHNSLDVSAPRHSPWILDWACLCSFMSCLHSQLGYSTVEFQALQLIVPAAFDAVGQPLAPCMLVHVLQI